LGRRYYPEHIEFHKQRVQVRKEKGESERELASSTVRNFFWPVKNFIEAHKRDLHADVDWKRLSKALPETQSYSSDDRVPTIEEICEVFVRN
jgi:CRISPR/Cas system Type II protein with McrA/HNH and RuvC-like nuclease domain